MRALCEKHGVAYGHYGRAPDDASKAIAERFAGSEQLAFDV